MEHLYITSHGTLFIKDHTLAFEEDDITIFPIKQIKAIHLLGEVSINKRLLEKLSKEDIMLYVYNYYGKLIGAYYPILKTAGEIVLKQSIAYQNHEVRLMIIKEILYSSVVRIIQMIKIFDKAYEKYIHKIQSLITTISECSIYENLLSIEGRIRQIYYDVLKQEWNVNGFIFEKRSYYPPRNYLNSLMSLANALLYSKINTIIITSGLIPSIGYLHATNKRPESFVYDISELYKPIICDMLIDYVIKKSVITINDFEQDLKLKNDKLRIFIQHFENRLHDTIKLKHRTLTLHGCIQEDVYQLKRFFLENKPMNFIKFYDEKLAIIKKS